MANVTDGTSDKGLTVHAHAKGAPAEELPVSVKAPIITDGTTAEGVQPLLDFVASIEAHSNTEVAAEEAKRLQPYFNAVSTYLARTLEKEYPKGMRYLLNYKRKRRKKTLKDLIASPRLTDLFNAMAGYARVTFTSDVVIMPRSIHVGPAAHLFNSAYNATFKYGDHSFGFGFLKLFEGGHEATARSSTTIPTFTLDTQLMEEITPHRPAALYRCFQAVVTDMDHDMLHHLHSPHIIERVAHKFDTQDYSNALDKWGSSMPDGSSYAPAIEEWSQISHGRVFMTPGNDALIKEVGANLDRYFDELARIGKALPKERAHEVVDYFGTVMAQTLSRTFPFNHPLMTRCLDRMQAADPFSGEELLEAAIEQFAKMTTDGPFDSWNNSPAYVRGYVRRDSVSVIADIIKGYRQQGLDILPDDDKDLSFKGLKFLQLAKLEPDETRSHVPAPVGQREQKVRTNSDSAFLDLVSAVAKTTGYRPK